MKKKKILITGADGFLGSHLTERFVKLGYDVSATCMYTFNNNLGWLEHICPEIKKKINILISDIRDYSQINKIIKGHDFVYHLAALIGIPYSYNAVKSYIDTNVLGTYNVLESSKNNNVKKIFITSTSEVYGSAKFIPMNEFHPLQAQSPYSASKIAADSFAYSYFCSFNLPITILRPFNIFGPRQSLRAIIPTIIMQLLENKSLKLGNLYTTRDFNFIDDTVEAFVKALQVKEFGKTYNIGTGINFSIKEVAEIIAKEIGVFKYTIKKEKIRLRPKKSEVIDLVCDSSEFNKKFKWKPSIKNAETLKIKLKKTIKWYLDKNNLKKFQNVSYFE